MRAQSTDIDRTDDDGYTALMSASAQGHHGVVRALVENGAVVDRPDHRGYTALMYAVNVEQHSCAHTARILRPNELDINRSNNDMGTTFLMQKKPY